MENEKINGELEIEEKEINIIRKDSKILFDGRSQFVIKIPKDIERYYNIKKDKFIFEFNIDITKSKKEPQLFKIKGVKSGN